MIMKHKLTRQWVQQPEWHGNPALNMKCWGKVMRTEHRSRRVPVYVFGGGDPPYEKWGSYCVSAGADSELSHSGYIPGCASAVDVMAGIDAKFASLQ